MTDGSVRDMPRAAGPAARIDRWPAVFAVAFSSFSLVLSEFLPIGLLTDIADGLRISPGTAGLLVVTPGLAATVATPLATILAGRTDRRTVLVALAAARPGPLPPSPAASPSPPWPACRSAP